MLESVFRMYWWLLMMNTDHNAEGHSAVC